jgi:two-component system sensor histidine kinase/response regulator
MEENFITMVSHQLRSPLSTIAQYFEVILAGMAGKVEPKQEEMLSRARNRLESLMGLINDWLDLARIDRGQIVDKLKPVSLKKMLRDIVEFIQPSALKENIRIELIPFEGDDLVDGDEEKLGQAFSNLITNAINYNKSGGSVKIFLNEGDDLITVTVEDTGIGISEEHLPFIFDQFYRVKKGNGNEAKGTGLGLSIVKKIIELHGGTIQVSSEKGRGSTFKVFFPKMKQ